MRAFLLDPAARTIAALEWTAGDDAKAMAAALGAKSIDSAKVATARGIAAVAFVDDEGLLKPNACFRVDGYASPLAGKALVLGCDPQGNSVDCPLALDDLLDRVRWVEQALALAQHRADRAISTAYYRSMGCTVETDDLGLVSVITPPAGA